MLPFRIQLRAVFYKEAGYWVAHCLEMDVMGHDKTRQQAFTKLDDAIAIHIATSFRQNNRSNIFMPADARYFEMYIAGKDVATGEAVVKLHKEASDDARVSVESIEAREYTGSSAFA